MPAMNFMPGGNVLQIPLDAPTSFASEAGNAEVSLTWTDPKDKYATPEGETAQDPDQLVSVWSHTVLVRKTGSQPAGPNDGTVVISSSVRNQYQSTPYVDTGLTNDTVYYYGVFAYNEDGVASPGAFTNATPVAGTPLSQLAEGTLIKILENGSPVEFYLAKHNYESGLNGAGRELVVRKDCYEIGQWGSGLRYSQSNLNDWCVSTYLDLFSVEVKSLIGTTMFPVHDGTIITDTKPVFILSLAELGWPDYNWAAPAEGSPLPIASTLATAYLNGSQVTQWTRSPRYDTGPDVWGVNSSGPTALIGTTPNGGRRPAFTLPGDTFIDVDLNVVP